MYRVVLLIHIASAIGMFVGLSVMLAAVFGLRRASSASHAEAVLGTVSKIKLVFIPSMILLLLSGLYMLGEAISKDRDIGWMIVALIGFVAMGMIGNMVGDKETRALQKALVGDKASLPDQLRLKARDPGALLPLVYTLWLGVGILVLMVFQFETFISVVVMLCALVLAFLTALMMRQQRSGTASRG